MFESVQEFYQSGKWKKFIKALKAERINENGETICEMCGKPIVNKFDCIGHHKIHLTAENVNDFNISLNPDNIALIHAGCHNQHHNKGFKRPDYNIYLIYGSPCSGKSTYLNNVRKDGDFIIDIDRMRQCISGNDTHIINGNLNQIVFKIRDLLMECAKLRVGYWNNCWIVGGFPLAIERERLQRELNCELIYIESTKEQCLERLHQNPNGRDIAKWEKYIEQWWTRYSTPLG